jgi:hypothetical protein
LGWDLEDGNESAPFFLDLFSRQTVLSLRVWPLHCFVMRCLHLTEEFWLKRILKYVLTYSRNRETASKSTILISVLFSTTDDIIHLLFFWELGILLMVYYLRLDPSNCFLLFGSASVRKKFECSFFFFQVEGYGLIV